MKKLITLFGTLCFSFGYSQNELPERNEFILKVKRNAKQTYTQQVQKTPYFAADKILQLYPYEKVNVEIEIKADTIYSMKTVKNVLHPDRTLEIEFCQTVENYIAKPTQLWIKNPFAQTLQYNVMAYSVEVNEWKTTAHAANAKSSTNQVWRDDVVSSLVLKDWKFIRTLKDN